MELVGIFFAAQTGMDDTGRLQVSGGVWDWIPQTTDPSIVGDLVLLTKGSSDGPVIVEITRADGEVAVMTIPANPLSQLNGWVTISIDFLWLTPASGRQQIAVRTPELGGNALTLEYDVR